MRKSREVASAKAAGVYSTAGCLSATLGHAHPKRTSSLPEHIAIVLWLPESPRASADSPIAVRLGSILPAIQRALLSTESAPPAIFVIDCSPLMPSSGSARAIMDKEISDSGADRHLGKQISKPVSRVLDRLCSGYRGSITLFGIQESAPLALCLLEHGAKWGTVTRAALLKPHLSSAAVNALLVKPAQAKVTLDVLYESERDCQRRDGAVRHSYPDGTSHVLDSHVTVGRALHAALLSLGTADLRGTLLEAGGASLQLDPDEIDSSGLTVC